MAGSLSESQVEHFRREGYAFPFNAISGEEAATCVAKIDSYDAILGEESAEAAQDQSPCSRALDRCAGAQYEHP